ncbi:MAG: phosphoribosyltransferase [Planctomycetaceae bacterium]
MQELLSAQQIATGVAQLAARLDARFAGQPVTLVGVLDGGLVFLADLIRQLRLPVQVETIRASSYRGATQQAGELWIDPRRLEGLAGRQVILVDDIFDTGETLERLREVAAGWGAAGVCTAVLLWKRARSRAGRAPDDYVFEIPGLFVVGYGLDYKGEHRQLPGIAVLTHQGGDPARLPPST